VHHSVDVDVVYTLDCTFTKSTKAFLMPVIIGNQQRAHGISIGDVYLHNVDFQRAARLAALSYG
jgi:hypothetical protein